MEVKQKNAFLHVNHASKPELISSLASYVQAEREEGDGSLQLLDQPAELD